MITISMVNNKGGVGKTTSAVNLAYYLAEIKKMKVLLIDADPQGNATSYLIEDKSNISGTFLDAFKNDNIKDYIIKAKENLFILPANMSLSKAEIEMLSILNKEVRMRKLIKKIEKYFDIIVIDTAPNLSLLTINSLVASDYIYIPVKIGGFEFDGVRNVLDIVNQIKESEINKNIKSRVFFTQFDNRNLLSRELPKQIKQQITEEYECEFLETYIRNNIKLSESVLSNISIFEYDKESNGSQDYKKLAEEIIEKEGLIENE